MASSDPPEQAYRRDPRGASRQRGGYSLETSNNDPPSSSSSVTSGGSSKINYRFARPEPSQPSVVPRPPHHASQSHASQSHASQSHASQSHASQSHASQSHASQSHASQSHALSSREYYDDVASVATIPSITPPSVLRNGGSNGVANGMGSINNNNHSDGGFNSGSSSFGNREHIAELRNKRLASTRRINSNDQYNYHGISNTDDERSIYSSSSYGSQNTASTFGNRVYQRGMDAMDVMDVFLPNKKRSRFTLAISALVGLVGMMFYMYNPLGGNYITTNGMMPSSRSLKDLDDEAAMRSTSTTAGGVSAALQHGDFLDDFDQRRRRAADLPDGTIFSEPAHTRMCRTIVERLDSYDSGVTSFEQTIFTESEYVCRDPDAPYTAVLNMFAAQLLDSANNEIGLNVDYTHRCARWERYCTGNMTTIQFHLPDPLSTTAHTFEPGCVNAPTLRTICEGCLASDDPTDPDCVLFPQGYLDTNTNTCNLGCYFSQVLPWIRSNLRTVATHWLNTVESRALTFWLRNAAEFSHREKDDMEVSVVSLSCSNDDCDMSMAECVCEFEPLPNWVYAMHVPRSSTNVAIVVSPTCSKFGEGCMLHAQELFHFFKQLYPRADITENVITSTSSWYMRMITADHLVCPPGVGCLLPSIARDAYTYVYEVTSPTVRTWLTCTPQDYLNRLTIPSHPPAFVEGDCRHLRARMGEWSPADADMSSSLQYNDPVDGYLGCADTNFLATPEDPYRPPTTFQWDETVWATCPIEVMTKENFCAQMDRLGLKRILFVGDHTTMSQAVSLTSILNANTDISLDPAVVPNFSKTIPCPNHPTFDITYIRNDRLEEAGTAPSPGTPNCGPNNDHYCYPWSSDYSNYANKQLLIVNTGYHWGDDWEGYIANFQNFVGRIDEIAAANAARAIDILMFRTSIPGHKECDLHDTVYGHYREYCPRIVNGAFWHWWGELPPYNDYAIRIINEWNLLNTVKSGANIELLDPWYMTVLRPDGHLSGSDAGPSCNMSPQECMLYSLPGPVDWWNHLLLMQLKDVEIHLDSSSPLQAWRI